ncbi:MAG: two pore domain potassium channel family protein [Burkholderiales bacterium]|nr:two pore domain potassium channel family protein [Burkholderiales bacterium]MCC7115661.1 two pore domain potassium channel family protein [Burkholderiales bacterium]
MVITPSARVWRFLRGDGSLTLSVVLLALFLFALYPMLEVDAIPPWWLDGAFAGFLVAGGFFVFEPRPIVRTFVLLVAATLATRVAGYQMHSRAVEAIEAMLIMATAATFAMLLITRVLRDGRINVHRIIGACGTFLLLGLLFAEAFRLIAMFVPNAYAIGGTPASAATLQNRFVYFSFITLTSTGYGDITPIHPYTRSLAAFEALTGQLYLAVLIARLVGLEIVWRESVREARETGASPGRPPPS